jgi:hypothetical protein
MRTQHLVSVLLLIIPAALGCATERVNPERMAASESAVRAAEELGGGSNPQAALHIKLAQEQLQAARNLAQHNYAREANRMLARAQADGELALAYAKQAREEQVVRGLQQRDQQEEQKRQQQQPTGGAGQPKGDDPDPDASPGEGSGAQEGVGP